MQKSEEVLDAYTIIDKFGIDIRSIIPCQSDVKAIVVVDVDKARYELWPVSGFALVESFAIRGGDVKTDKKDCRVLPMLAFPNGNVQPAFTFLLPSYAGLVYPWQKRQSVQEKAASKAREMLRDRQLQEAAADSDGEEKEKTPDEMFLDGLEGEDEG